MSCSSQSAITPVLLCSHGQFVTSKLLQTNLSASSVHYAYALALGTLQMQTGCICCNNAGTANQVLCFGSPQYVFQASAWRPPESVPPHSHALEACEAFLSCTVYLARRLSPCLKLLPPLQASPKAFQVSLQTNEMSVTPNDCYCCFQWRPI